MQYRYFKHNGILDLAYYASEIWHDLLYLVKLQCICIYCQFSNAGSFTKFTSNILVSISLFFGVHILFMFQGAGMFHPPSRNWLSPQGNSSGFLVKKTMKMDIPVDKYPNVRCCFHLLFPLVHFRWILYDCDIMLSSSTLWVDYLVQGEILLSELRQTPTVVSWLEAVAA